MNTDAQVLFTVSANPPNEQSVRYRQDVTNHRNVKTKSSSRFKVESWVGDQEAFSKLAAVCQEIMADAIQRRKTDVRELAQSERAEWVKSNNFYEHESEIEAAWQNRVSRLLAEVEDSFKVELTAIHNRLDQEMTGDFEEVLESLEMGDLKQLSLRAGRLYSGIFDGGYGLSVEFSRAYGCDVNLAGYENDWIVLANEKLQRTLLGRRPWYWWLRRWSVNVPIFLIPIFVILISVGFFRFRESDKLYDLFTTMGSIAFFLYVAFGLGWILRKLLPAFELVAPGESGKGARNLGLAFGALAWIGSIVVPLLLKL